MFEEKQDLFYMFLNAPLPESKRAAMFKEVFVSFAKTLIRLFSFQGREETAPKPDLKNRKVIFANTYNNYGALDFLLGLYPGSLLVCGGDCWVEKHKKGLPLGRDFQDREPLGRYLFLFYLFLKKRFFLEHYRLILREYGRIASYEQVFKNNLPECVFVSNDHTPSSRAFILAARKAGIPCFYIQHGCVTEDYPPMRASHALLYGDYSEKIYRGIKGSEGVFVKVGLHRLDGYAGQIRNKKSSGLIGVAFNHRDCPEDVFRLCALLAGHFSKDNIVVRPHPADKRKYACDFTMSDPARESSLDFLSRIDVLAAGNSSILLEAAGMNVWPLFYHFGPAGEPLDDRMAFVRTGLAEAFRDESELIEKIKSLKARPVFEARKKIHSYDASAGSAFEFRVTERIKGLVDDVLMERKRPG